MSGLLNIIIYSRQIIYNHDKIETSVIFSDCDLSCYGALGTCGTFLLSDLSSCCMQEG